MNVAELLANRVEEVAAFSTLLFKKRRRTENNNNNNNDNSNDNYLFPIKPIAPHYRRPSSANIPLSNVIQSAKLRLKRMEHFTRLSSNSEEFSFKKENNLFSKKKRVLTYNQWCLLLKRRRRLALRRRPTACRRVQRRGLALRYGKIQKPLCNCNNNNSNSNNNSNNNMVSDSMSTSSSIKSKKTSILWLPSHYYMCRRFHYHIHKIYIDECNFSNIVKDNCSSFSSDNIAVRISIPTICQRKQHRILQRWVSWLPSIYYSNNNCILDNIKIPRKIIKSKPTAVPPPICFATDKSHMCVWKIQSKEIENFSNISVEKIMEFLMIRTNKTNPIMMYKKNFSISNENNNSEENKWNEMENNVFYGYMWSSYDLSLNQNNILKNEIFRSSVKSFVIPVILIKDSKLNKTNFFLIASYPLRFGSRARRNLNIKLISYWNPCDKAEMKSSLFELWCCADAVKNSYSVNQNKSNNNKSSIIVELLQKQVDNALLKWNSIINKDSSFNKKNKKLIYIFPSISPNTTTINHNTCSIRKCVMTILVISENLFPYNFNKSSTIVENSSYGNSQNHFQLSRHIFNSLITSPTIIINNKTKGNTNNINSIFFQCKKLGYTNTVRVIGEDERNILLRLTGCSAFPDEVGLNNKFQISPMVHLRCSLSNAHQRVLLKFSQKGGRNHQCEGSLLLMLTSEQNNNNTNTSSSALTHIGTITSSPFFSMRFGCRVAFAWVWDQVGWKLVEKHLENSTNPILLNDNKEEYNNEEKEMNNYSNNNNICFFVSAAEKFSLLKPFLCETVTHIPGCSDLNSKRKRKRSLCEKKSNLSYNKNSTLIKSLREMELRLCDSECCFPVEVVSFGTMKRQIV